ncbi:bone morphogenetic protein 10-like isoform X1 [Centruroides vittatus]|uniref:bone morphogenetic protein 10-like isoform X1 n=1 Tax=Centruroides vittatus TaxID=120091 RepID=UPI00350F9DE7
MRLILLSLLLLWIYRVPCTRSLTRPYIPQYMLDLYQNKAPSFAFDTVRSYSNIFGDPYENENIVQGNRHHFLGFNLSKSPPNERIGLAELRLYTKIGNDGKGESQITIFDILPNDQRKIIAKKSLYGISSSWETFNVTDAVVNWLQHPKQDHRLEVYLEGGDQQDLDVSLVPYRETEPLLLVYSVIENKSVVDGVLKRMRRSLVPHRIEKRSEDEDEEQEEMTNYIVEELGKKVTKRGKVRRRKNPCRRKPLKVKFSDINYDTWIIAPESYDAFECAGKCHFPMSAHLTPTKHAIIQTLMHQTNPKSASRSCCVPTKLAPISILYLDEDGSVTYNYEYEDMVVTECGCR